MISLIVAHDENLGIGKGNSMPWHIPSELETFKYLTVGKPVIMGRNTFESIGSKPLSKRLNIVITSGSDYLELQEQYSNLLIVPDWDTALAIASEEQPEREIMVIGGGMIYNQAIERADRIYATEIKNSFECDTFFPSYQEDFEELYRSSDMVYNKESITYQYTIHERKREQLMI